MGPRSRRSPSRPIRPQGTAGHLGEIQGAAAAAIARAAVQNPKPVAAKQPIASDDVALRDRLIDAAHGNVISGPEIDDVTPVRVILEGGIELEDILYALGAKVDRRANSRSPAISSWAEWRFLRIVAETYARRTFVAEAIEEWTKRIQKAQGEPIHAPEPSSGVEPENASTVP